ncbi:hypothetical protein MYCTH_2296887 [Thermothelomyces thermophilus ATCC 42464]|uniref:IBR domain-containing protein n=1 Tax=Thermothelomyces thermophilus (strain ATCC 42464 / BCRC 31852 / DSM 1799) TaxID=573729 RepID=G2Q3B1_THET4|nr:uncharacterized protein MYCTH_2296887 [Thermothelomyces thermophilus ATCC 42464]AEO54372.1 hypothetical protein MYCTH_2296887 [Thermothelomyces thermophilus ATCC 42464]
MELACTICTTPLPNRPDRGGVVVFPCNHAHCLACLRRNYTLSAGPGPGPGDGPGARGPFRPVQCCPGSRLPVAALRRALGLGSAEVARYRARLAEHDAPRKLYCHDPRCGRFIPELLRDARAGRCRACHARTCVRCGGRAHFGAGGGCGEVESDFVGGGGGGSGFGRGRAISELDKRSKKKKEEEEEAEKRFRRVAREMGW